MTWTFPAGPRQSVDLTATFDSTGSVQRILNWTAIFDEVHDFELNTRTRCERDRSDRLGRGAQRRRHTRTQDARIDFVGAGGVDPEIPQNGFNRGSAAAVAAGGATPEDWDLIEAYIRSLAEPPRSNPDRWRSGGRATSLPGRRLPKLSWRRALDPVRALLQPAARR